MLRVVLSFERTSAGMKECVFTLMRNQRSEERDCLSLPARDFHS